MDHSPHEAAADPDASLGTDPDPHRTDSSTDQLQPTPLRVGLIGYGVAGAYFHAPLIAAEPMLELDTVVTAGSERQREIAKRYPATRTVSEVDALFARADELDLVVLASPNRTHADLASRALHAGLPVVVEKPVAGTSKEVAELAELARDRGLLLSAFHNRRWDSDFRTLSSLLADGSLGTVYRFESHFERWRPELRGHWRESGDPAELGGLLYDLGPHVVDQALTLFGPVATVYAESDVRRDPKAADDDTFLALTHVGGVRSHLWLSATAAQLGPRFRVLGSKAAYVKYGLDPQEAVLRAGKHPVPGAPWGSEPPSAWGRLGTLEDATPVPSLDGDYPAYYAAIAAAVRDGGVPPVTADQAADTVRVLEAARVSAAERRVVEMS